MEYKIEGRVRIPADECKEFEESLNNKSFDFFRYLSENNANIKIKKRNKYAEKSNKKAINSLIDSLNTSNQ